MSSSWNESAIVMDFTEIDVVAGTLEISGKRFVVVAQTDYDRLKRRAGVADDTPLPPMPPKLDSGNYPAVDALRTTLAKKLIKRRWAAGLTQAEVARRAGVRPETLNRIEKAKVSADTATITKIDRILTKAERDAVDCNN